MESRCNHEAAGNGAKLQKRYEIKKQTILTHTGNKVGQSKHDLCGGKEYRGQKVSPQSVPQPAQL
jgi:hypothetical protein